MGKKVFICKKCGLSYNEDKFQNLTTPSRCSCGFTDYFKTDIDVDVWNEMSVIDKNKVRYDVIDYDFLDKRKKNTVVIININEQESRKTISTAYQGFKVTISEVLINQGFLIGALHIFLIALIVEPLGITGFILWIIYKFFIFGFFYARFNLSWHIKKGWIPFSDEDKKKISDIGVANVPTSFVKQSSKNVENNKDFVEELECVTENIEENVEKIVTNLEKPIEVQSEIFQEKFDEPTEAIKEQKCIQEATTPEEKDEDPIFLNKTENKVKKYMFCRFCGTKIPYESKYCNKCGKKLV